MGTYNTYCGISGIAIKEDERCVLLLLQKTKDFTINMPYQPTALPIIGTYNGEGGIEDIATGMHTGIIEKYRNYFIEDINEHLKDEIYMFIDIDVWDELSKKIYGDYHPLWSDLKNADFMSIKHELYLLMGEFFTIMNISYDGDVLDLKTKLTDYIDIFKKETPNTITKEILDKFDYFKNDLVKLKILQENLRCMSKCFLPYNNDLSKGNDNLLGYKEITEIFLNINQKKLDKELED